MDFKQKLEMPRVLVGIGMVLAFLGCLFPTTIITADYAENKIKEYDRLVSTWQSTLRKYESQIDEEKSSNGDARLIHSYEIERDRAEKQVKKWVKKSEKMSAKLEKVEEKYAHQAEENAVKAQAILDEADALCEQIEDETSAKMDEILAPAIAKIEEMGFFVENEMVVAQKSKSEIFQEEENLEESEILEGEEGEQEVLEETELSETAEILQVEEVPIEEPEEIEIDPVKFEAAEKIYDDAYRKADEIFTKAEERVEKIMQKAESLANRLEKPKMSGNVFSCAVLLNVDGIAYLATLLIAVFLCAIAGIVLFFISKSIVGLFLCWIVAFGFGLASLIANCLVFIAGPFVYMAFGSYVIFVGMTLAIIGLVSTSIKIGKK